MYTYTCLHMYIHRVQLNSHFSDSLGSCVHSEDVDFVQPQAIFFLTVSG